ncbi:MAG TPA: amino acid racemase [Limnochordales bacterium]
MKTIGILGGMGPEATADLFVRIIRLVRATRDQDHPRVIIDSNSQIPDRTAAIKGEGPSPLPALVETARNLQRAGAELIAMPCNSAHAWYDEIAAAVDVPVLHMIRLTAEETCRRLHRDSAAPPSGPVLVLATSGTIQSGLYQRALGALGLDAAVPEPGAQARVMEAIYQVKAGKPAVARSLALDVLVSETARLAPAAVILGCTELPLVLGQGDLDRPVVDSTEVLARAAVQAALG